MQKELKTPEYKTYLISYNFEGQRWGFEILATDKEEALKRLECIRCNGQIDGELVFKIPLFNPLDLIKKMFKK